MFPYYNNECMEIIIGLIKRQAFKTTTIYIPTTSRNESCFK